MRTIIALAAVATALASTPAAAQSRWDGRYVYEESAGRTAGGTGIVVTWTLTIGPGLCRLTAEGFQTNDSYRCGTTAQGNRLAVRWIANSDGSLRNAYGIVRYRPNQPLFTLTRSPRGLTTIWQGLDTNIEGKRPGRYFVRA